MILRSGDGEKLISIRSRGILEKLTFVLEIGEPEKSA